MTRKIMILPALIFALMLFILPSAMALLSTVTINNPVTNQQIRTSTTFDFNISVTTTNPTNTTNVTVWFGSTAVGLNSTINGSRTSPTSYDFIVHANLASISEGSYTVKAEARNDSSIQPAGSLNSSSITIIIDRTPPVCQVGISRTKIAPKQLIEVTCTPADSNTINTSAYNMYIQDPSGLQTTTADTSGRASFNGIATFAKGLYTAGCNAVDNAGNSCTNATTNFFTKNDIAPDTGDSSQAPSTDSSQQVPPPSNLMMYLGLGAALIIIIVLLLLVFVVIPAMKGKRK